MTAPPRILRLHARHCIAQERFKRELGLILLVDFMPMARDRDGNVDELLPPLAGDTGEAIARMAGVKWPNEFNATFDRATVCTDQIEWEMAKRVRRRGVELIEEINAYAHRQPVLLIGASVATAMAIDYLPPLQWRATPILSNRIVATIHKPKVLIENGTPAQFEAVQLFLRGSLQTLREQAAALRRELSQEPTT